jgi:hypothetical protein
VQGVEESVGGVGAKKNKDKKAGVNSQAEKARVEKLAAMFGTKSHSIQEDETVHFFPEKIKKSVVSCVYVCVCV